jgi:hypothetical protein
VRRFKEKRLSGLTAEAQKWFAELERVTPEKPKKTGGAEDDDPKEGLVIRTAMVSKPQIIEHLKEMTDWYANQIEPAVIASCEKYLPEQCYLCEVSVTELFTTNRRKIADIVAPVLLIPPNSSGR